MNTLVTDVTTKDNVLMNAPVSWQTGHSFTSTHVRCQHLSNKPSKWCFAKNDECLWLACFYLLL